MSDEPYPILGAHGERTTLFEFLRELTEGCNIEIVYGSPADGTCCAEGCDLVAYNSTAIGLAFCDVHFSQFYSLERGPTLKTGSVDTRPIG